MGLETIQVLAGTSSALGLLAVIAYFIFQMQMRSTERSVRAIVEGDPLFDAEKVVQILAQFGNDEQRLKALEVMANHDRGRATELLNKIKDDVDVNRLNRVTLEHQRRTLLIAAAVLIVLGISGLAYTWIERSRQDSSGDHPADESGSASQKAGPVTYKTCRLPEFGQEGWRWSEEVEQSSGWMGGGRSQKDWCNDLAGSFIHQRNIGPEHKVETLGMSESSKKDFFGHASYNYHCKIKISWEPIYAERQDPRCGVLN